MCPTCSHTMHKITDQMAWCPRCGTIKEQRGDRKIIERPKLVTRTREFLEGVSPAMSMDAQVIGIYESIGEANPY